MFVVDLIRCQIGVVGDTSVPQDRRKKPDEFGSFLRYQLSRRHQLPPTDSICFIFTCYSNRYPSSLLPFSFVRGRSHRSWPHPSMTLDYHRLGPSLKFITL